MGDARVLTVEEARAAARDVLRKRMIGPDTKAEVLPAAGPTLEAFITQQYLPIVKTYKIIWDTDESVLRNHAIPALGMLPMGQITVPQVSLS